MPGRVLGGLAGGQQGLELTPEPGDLAFGVREVPLHTQVEDRQEALNAIAGGTDDGRTVPVVQLQREGGRQEAQAILEAGLGRTCRPGAHDPGATG